MDERDLDPVAMVGTDTQLLSAIANEERGPVLRLWRNRPCVVVPTLEARRPDFAAAASRLSGIGWPIVVRSSGGSAVVHTRGALMVSLLFHTDPRTRLSPEDSYRFLCDPIIAALRDRGLDAGVGAVAGAMCDGRFNILIAGQKVAGTAQRWARSRITEQGFAVLAHACLYLSDDLWPALTIIQRYYEMLGIDHQFRRDAHTCVADAQRDQGCGFKAVSGAHFVGTLVRHYENLAVPQKDCAREELRTWGNGDGIVRGNIIGARRPQSSLASGCKSPPLIQRD